MRAIFVTVKPFENYRIICDVYGVTCFSEKMFTVGLNMGLPLGTGVEQNSPCRANTMTLSKEKVPGAKVSKEGHADSLL